METPLPERWSAGTIIESTLVWGGVVLLVGFLILTVLSPLATDTGRPASRTECKNHLKQLALAMHNYHDQYGSFPPAYIADKNGRPMHSWRVLLLPFLEFGHLYKEYRFDEPWNGPHNRLLAEPAPSVFHCPADTGTKTDTSYVVVVGPKTIFPGASSIKIADIEDGTSNTILLVEATDSGINWLEPRDMSYEDAVRGINAKTSWGISSHHEGGAMVAFADGSRELLPDQTPLQQLRLLLERNDGRPASMHRPPVAPTSR
jgi:prepilin-type processing-associated H-X9-DG protein